MTSIVLIAGRPTAVQLALLQRALNMDAAKDVAQDSLTSQLAFLQQILNAEAVLNSQSSEVPDKTYFVRIDVRMFPYRESEGEGGGDDAIVEGGYERFSFLCRDPFSDVLLESYISPTVPQEIHRFIPSKDTLPRHHKKMLATNKCAHSPNRQRRFQRHFW